MCKRWGSPGSLPEQPAEFAPDSTVQKASSGARAVHLQQLYKGITVYGAARTVRFQPDGAITESVGSTVTVAENRPVRPGLTVEDAVQRAAEHVASPDEDEQGKTDAFGEPLRPASVDLAGFEPRVIAAFPDRPDFASVLEPGPFGAEIKASLIWFPLDELRLSWEVLLTLGNYDEQYRSIVDAETGEILFCKQLVTSAAGRGNVYRVHGSQDRELVDFPMELEEHGLPIPGDLIAGFPDPWVEEGSASGNSVFAHLDDTGPTLEGIISGETVVFDPEDPVGDDQKVLNIFFYNCVMHDYFYLLGFREHDGNFQRDNLGRGGLGSDPCRRARLPGPVQGTATHGDARSTDEQPDDEHGPRVQRPTATPPSTPSVVFHEFMHGVTNRLVGGPLNVRRARRSSERRHGRGLGRLRRLHDQ